MTNINYKYINNELWDKSEIIDFSFTVFDGISLTCGLTVTDDSDVISNLLLNFGNIIAYSEFNESDLMFSEHVKTNKNCIGLFESRNSYFLKKVIENNGLNSSDLISYLLVSNDLILEVVTSDIVNVKKNVESFFKSDLGEFEF